MVFATGGKWLYEKLMELKEDIYGGQSDEKVDQLIDKEYFHLMRISSVYLRMDKRNRLLSSFQLIFYFSSLLYHYILLARSTFFVSKLNMVLFSQSAHFCLLLQLTVIMVVFFQTKHKQMILFHKMLSVGFFDYKEPPTPGDDDIRSAMVKERRLLSMIPTGAALAGGMVLVASPIVDKMVGSYDMEMLKEFSTHLPYPYGKYPYQTKEGISYYLSVGGQLVVGFLLAVIIGTGGFLFLNLAQNVSLQFKLLQNSLHHLEFRAEAMYFRLFGKTKGDVTSQYDDQQFAYCYSMCLRKNFKHHQVILRAFQYTEEIMSVPIFLAYMTGTIVIALSLISAGSMKELPGTTVSAMILCGVEVGYMFLFSSFGQRLGDLNMDLRFKIYSIKWYLCSKRVKNDMMIFQEKTMKPLTMMAGGIVPANMETFASVMNSAYSYYNLVNAFGN